MSRTAHHIRDYIETQFMDRICAGRHLAFDSVWIAVARILATFTISAIKDAEGNLVKPQVQFTTALTRWVNLLRRIYKPCYTDATIRQAEPFDADIQPRDETARRLIAGL